MTTLYKLLVVDDEHLICDGLFSYNWEQLGFKAIGTAKNGKMALKFIENNQVDVIIADIKMPVMDGLEMSKIVKEKYPEMKIVILSGYKNFDYAREAIERNVYNYLLKPIDFKELDELFRKMKKDLDREYKNKQLFEKYKNKLKESLPLAASKFLNNILEGKVTNLEEIKEKIDIFELNLNYNYFCCVVLKFSTETNIKKLGEKVDDFLGTKGLGYRLIDKNYIYIIFNLKTNCKKKIEQYVNDLNLQNEEKKYLIGVGNIYDNILFIKDSLKEAKKLCQDKFYMEDDNIYFIWKHSNNDDLSTKYPYEKENDLLNAILEGNTEKSLDEFEKYWDDLNKDCVMRSHLIQFLNVLDYRLKKHKTSLKEIAGIFPSYNRQFQDVNTIKEIEFRLKNIIIDTTEKITDLNEKVIDSFYPAIKKAVNYIHNNYDKKITLKKLAEEVYLNPSYLSVLFKKETGENFIDYLTNYRIEKAKELLGRINLKIYQIANKVGYNNRKYFTEIFKKKTGITPNKYRKKYYSN